MTGYIERNGAWKRIKEAYIKTAEKVTFVPPISLITIPEQWKKVKEIWLNVDGSFWKKVFPAVITPFIENQVTLTSYEEPATGRTVLTGRHYHWVDGDTITYYFERISPIFSFSVIDTDVVPNPSSGSYDEEVYVIDYPNVVANADNEYRFHVNAANLETGGTADSYNTLATNVVVNAPRNITSISTSADTDTQITVYWTPGAYSESFRVEYKLSSSSTYNVWDHYNYSSFLNFAMITGLSSGTSYDFRVTPYSGVRITSTSSKGYFGNSSTTSATTLIAPGNVTNQSVLLNPSITSAGTASVTRIQGYGNANYVTVYTTTLDFVKNGSFVTISGATGSQSVLNGTWKTVPAANRYTFYLYNSSGTWASIPDQNYSPACTATYRNRVTPYTVSLFWTPGANTTKYELTLSMSNPSNFYFQTITINNGATSQYNFTSVGGQSIVKDYFITAQITPYNGSVVGNSSTFTQMGARSYTAGNVAVNTESAINSIAPSFVKVSGFGTAAAPWQGDTYALAPGSWIFNGDGSAQVAVVLRDWAVDFGEDYLIYEGYGDYYVTSRPFGIPSFTNYQIPSDSTYGSPLYLVSVVSNDSTLDAVYPGDQGFGTFAFAQTGDITRLRGPGASTAESTGGKTSTNLRFFIYQNTPNPPFWYYFLLKYNAPVFGGNGIYTTTLTSQGTAPTIANPHTLNITPLTAASWYIVYIYGYNNGVYSQEIFSLETYTSATAAPSLPVGSDFYFERSGNLLYWWKIADNYTNVHLIWVRLDRYLGGVYQTSFNYYFFPYFFTVTSNLPGYPSSPSTSIRYAIDISSLPSGQYYPFVGFYNYDFGFLGPVFATYIGTTYPFTK